MNENSEVIVSMPTAEYHAVERMSSSGIKQMLRSPAHYRQWKDTPAPPTPAMQFGTAVHTLVFEPQRVAECIAVMPEDAPERRSTADKAWHAAFARNAAGKVILSAEDFNRAQRAAEAVRSSLGWSLIGNGHVETALLWHDADNDVLCKAKPDYFASNGSICVDLKTTTDASREAFMRAVWNFRYDIQAAFYMQGLHVALGVLPHSFVWPVVETVEPFGVAWYRMGHSELEIARADIALALDVYGVCTRSNEWPGYSREIQELRLPAWARSNARNNPQPQEF
jgi:hypothetical protein